VWGKVTDGTLDRDGQIVDPDWAAEKLMDWFHDLGAPVRNMHSGTYPPAGKGLDLSIEDDGAYVRAAIVEPTAIKLLDLGVYKDFSVGIAEAPLYSDPMAPAGRLGKAGDPDGWINEISLVDTGSNKNAHLTIVKRAKRTAPPEVVMEILGYVGEEGTFTKAVRAQVAKAEWSQAYQNDLPDSSFAYIEPGGTKDEEGKTTPRDLRHFPYKDKDGSLDEGHVRNALARLEGNQSPHAEAARAKIEAAAESLGIGDDSNGKGKKMAEKAAKTAKGEMPEGHQACDSCDGTGVIKGELPCPNCKGKGHHPIGKGAKAKKGHGADDDVRSAIGDTADAIDDADDAVSDAQAAQRVDDATEPDGKATKGEGSVATSAPAQDGHMEPHAMSGTPSAGPFMLADKAKGGKAKKGKAAKKLKITVKPGDGDGDGNGNGGEDGDDDKCGKAAPMGGGEGGTDKPGPFPGAAKPFGKGKGKGKRKSAPAVPYDAVRMHDLLCPCYSVKAKKSAYGDVTPEMFDAEFIREALTRSTRKSAPADEIAEAALALQAATGLVHLAPKTFADLARAAHKGWLGADPGLPNMRPGLISPEQFRRGFLQGADDTVSHTTQVPSPDLKPTLAASQFDRGPLTDNQARPTLTSGTSVAKRSGGASAVKLRTFYTNAAQSEHTTQMGQLHDWIANNFPGCCPMANAPEGSASDSDGQMGRPAEMAAPLPPEGGVLDEKSGATVGAVRDTSRANKSAGTAELEPEDAIRAEVKRRVRQATKRQDREVRRLKRVVKSMSSQPDPRRGAVRSHPFARPKSASNPVRLAKAREAVEMIRTRDSRNVDEAYEELRDLNLSPRQFAQLATSVAD
jgi:hypothetical protein